MHFHTLSRETVTRMDDLCEEVCAGDVERFKSSLKDAGGDFSVSTIAWLYVPDRNDLPREMTLLHAACQAYRLNAKRKRPNENAKNKKRC